MKRIFPLLIALLAGCGSGDRSGSPSRDSGQPVQTASLTGVYEARGQGGQRGRMCMVAGGSGAASFALVTRRADGRGCGAAGEAVRSGKLVRLTMGGESQCIIEARASDTQLALPGSLPPGCAYYCARGATLAGTMFEKTGGTAEDAKRATDLAGDPLCG